ncbi:hypothetical protein PEDI_09960 [Persicobacter diffluens]|uniref:Uncharacterized protein n=1 Tax=Persicobacter diffluens TaxID=981 RepID=A0AAN5AJ17_9BACT|nr:hypothetical protein PEDI_09960 [Persicobacter diffluens]
MGVRFFLFFMRYCFFYLPLLILPFTVLAQIPEVKTFNAYNRDYATDWIAFSNSLDKDDMISQFIDYAQGQPAWVDRFSRERFYLGNYISLVDFDADEEDEIVYQGPLFGESQVFEIYKRKDDKTFDLIFSSQQGVITSEWNGEQLSRLYVRDWGCCMEEHITSVVFEVQMEQGQLKFQRSFQFVSHFLETKPKAYFKSPIAFQTLNESYTLRVTPEIVKEGLFVDLDPEKGNVLSHYPKGTEGIALAEKVDKTGRIWWYVLIDTSNQYTKSNIYLGSIEGDGYVSGWMSSRYLQILESN